MQNYVYKKKIFRVLQIKKKIFADGKKQKLKAFMLKPIFY